MNDQKTEANYWLQDNCQRAAQKPVNGKETVKKR